MGSLGFNQKKLGATRYAFLSIRELFPVCLQKKSPLFALKSLSEFKIVDNESF